MKEREDFLRWTTELEIKFLAYIGTWREPRKFCDLEEKINLLENYITAAEKRVHWGVIDKERVLAFAREKIWQLDEEGRKKK